MYARLSRHRFFAIIVVLVLVPIVVTVIAVIGGHWHPASDDALIVLRIRDVGGRHTPLTGVHSRFGWDHPGPLLFWLLALPFRVAGDTGVLVGVACLNGAALVATCLLARRRGGVSFAILVAISLLLFVRAFGPSRLLDPWNPWAALLPFFVYLLLAWSLAERDFATLPWLVLVGSFVVETHVGYLPLVVGLGAVAGGLLLLRPVSARRALDAPDRRARRRWMALAAVVAVLAWLGPVVQQMRGHPGNLGEIIAYFRNPSEPALGLRYGFGLMGRELPLAWVRGNDVGALGFVVPASTRPSLALLAAALVMGVIAWRRGTPPAMHLAVLVVSGAIVGVFASARITGVAGDYLLRWWWVLGALLWCSLAWSVWRAFPAARRAAVAPRLAPVALVAIAVLAAAVSWDAAGGRVPQRPFSTAVGRLSAPTRARLARDRHYLVRWIDTRDLGAAGVGLYLSLAEHGYDVKVERAFARPFGSWRASAPGAVDATITLVSGDDLGAGGAPTGAELVARYDPLGPRDRDRARRAGHGDPGATRSRDEVPADNGRFHHRAGVARAGRGRSRRCRRPVETPPPRNRLRRVRQPAGALTAARGRRATAKSTGVLGVISAVAKRCDASMPEPTPERPRPRSR